MLKNHEKVGIFAVDSKSLYMFRKNLMDHLKNRKIQVIGCCSLDHSFEHYKHLFSLKSVLLKPINFFNTGKNPFKDIITFKNIYSLLKKEKITHIFPYHIKPVLYTSLCCWLFPKIKIYPTVTGLGYLFTSSTFSIKMIRSFVCLLYKLAFKRSSKVFFQNQDDLDLFIEKKLIEKNKAHLVNGSGVCLEEYPFSPLPEAISFVFVGRINKDKGIMEYLKACKEVKNKYPHISCRLIGSFSYNPTFISLEIIQQHCINSGVEYIGEVEDVRPWLQQTSVFVLPSYREGVPRAGLEALAMGRPVITTDAPGCKEIIQDGMNGYIIPPRNFEKLAEAMIKMIETPEKLTTMGQESRKLAENKFDVNLISKTMLEIAELGVK